MRVHQGSLPENTQILQNRVDNRPFTHQLDVVFTASDEPLAVRVLESLETSYHRTKVTFSELFAVFTSSSPIIAFSLGCLLTEDVWCLDNRGILSLSVTEATYQRLGIGGGIRTNNKSKFLIRLQLYNTAPPSLHVREALRQWDTRRAQLGEEGWDVLLSAFAVPADKLSTTCQIVRPRIQVMPNAWIPSCLLPSFGSGDVSEGLSRLYEWLGLAALGSQRLLVDDDVNPYVASYEPPSGSSVGRITHLRWTGLLSPSFVQSVLKEVLMRTGTLRAISAVSFNTSASHITSSGTAREGEFVWTLILSEGVENPSCETRWILAEDGTS